MESENIKNTNSDNSDNNNNNLSSAKWVETFGVNNGFNKFAMQW